MPPRTPRPALVVTGGSRGIGAATARLAAERGYAVAAYDRCRVCAAPVVVEEILQVGGDAEAAQADVAREEEAVRLFETDRGVLKTVGVLVNDVGGLEAQARVETKAADRPRPTRVVQGVSPHDQRPNRSSHAAMVAPVEHSAPTWW